MKDPLKNGESKKAAIRFGNGSESCVVCTNQLKVTNLSAWHAAWVGAGWLPALLLVAGDLAKAIGNRIALNAIAAAARGWAGGLAGQRMGDGAR